MPGTTNTVSAAPKNSVDFTKVGVGTMLFLLGITGAVWLTNALLDASDAVGVVDRRTVIPRVLSAFGSSLLAGLGAFVGFEGLLPAKRWAGGLLSALFAALSLGLVVLVFVKRPGSEVSTGSLSADKPFAQRVLISGGNGYRYLITLETSGTLQATLRLRGEGFEIEAAGSAENGIQRLEGVLPGTATWTALITRTSGEGQYRLFVNDSPPKELVVPLDEQARELPAGIAFASYRLKLVTAQNLYVRVRSADGGLAPAVALMDSSGQDLLVATKADAGSSVMFLRALAGTYTLRVQPVGSAQYLLTLTDSDPASPSSPPSTVATPATGAVTVPNVYRLPVQEALAQLTAAGLRVRSYTVCSNTLSGPDNTGRVRQVVVSGATSSAEEQEVVGSTGVRADYATLPGGTSVDVKVANGSPCAA